MFYLAMMAAGTGAGWWLHLRARRYAEVQEALAVDDDAGVALRVARHEAHTRGQEPSTLHVLYGLLQVDAVTAAIAAAGGDADALEDRVLAALAGGGVGEPEALERVLVRAAWTARQCERRIRCADLWAYLEDDRAGAVLVAQRLDRGAVLFRMTHGAVPPALPGHDRGTATVELRDDAYTTKEFVVEALIEGFGLDPAEAERVMEAVHTSGHGTLGPMSMAAARVGVIAVRDLAQRTGSPLWIAVVPAA